MSRPIIGRLTPFVKGRSEQYTIAFTYDGAQSFSNKITIYNASSNMSVVYTGMNTTMQYNNSVPASVLKEGVQYAAEIICYDRDGNPSPTSEKAYFWCLATPTFSFDGLTDTDYTIRNASYNARVIYSQAQGERIRQFRFYLYNFQKALLLASDVMYDETNMSYNFKGFENMSDYYIRCVALTERDVILDTGYVHIYVQYALPLSYSTLTLKSDNGDGIVEYHTNLVVIEATRDDYDYFDGMVDVEGDTLTYNSRFVIDGDFSMAIRHQFTVGKIMTCSNSDYGMTLEIVNCGGGEFRYRLLVPNGIANYTLWSEPFTISNDQIMMTCWIRRINNIYKLVYFKRIVDNRFGLILGEGNNATGAPRDKTISVEAKDVFIDHKEINPTVKIDRENVRVSFEEVTPEHPARYDIWIGEEVLS